MERAVTLFPQPDSPTRPWVSPATDGEIDLVYGFDNAFIRPKVSAQIFDFEQVLLVAGHRFKVFSSLDRGHRGGHRQED